jgi:hypothetical protein
VEQEWECSTGPDLTGILSTHFFNLYLSSSCLRGYEEVGFEALGVVGGDGGGGGMGCLVGVAVPDVTGAAGDGLAIRLCVGWLDG